MYRMYEAIIILRIDNVTKALCYKDVAVARIKVEKLRNDGHDAWLYICEELTRDGG